MCTLFNRPAVQKCIWAALNEEYNANVKDDTSLRNRTKGLGLDDTEIRNNTYDVITKAVKDKGCRLTKLTPAGLARCKSVGDVVDAVTDDILSN
jgi:hypothetical protein